MQQYKEVVQNLNKFSKHDVLMFLSFRIMSFKRKFIKEIKHQQGAGVKHAYMIYLVIASI